MPPKKEEKEKKYVLWGRPGNTLKMGIVGLPNVGKSTTFNLLSHLHVPAENYSFCTKKPNQARIPIPDQRFNTLCKKFKPKSQASAFLTIIDIAGLVRGASKGQGLGNAFLSHIRQIDGFYHVVRAFDDQQIVHYELDVDPIRDMQIINEELGFKDIEYCENRIADCQKKIVRANEKQAQAEKDILLRVIENIKEGRWVRNSEWTANQIQILNRHCLLTAKPVVYLINLSQQDFIKKKNKWLGKIKKFIDQKNPGQIIAYSAIFQKNLQIKKQEQQKNKEEQKQNQKKNEEQKEPQQKKLPVSVSSIPRIIKSGYHCLDLIHFFTAGQDQVKCWTLRRGSKAPQAAGVIHTDFEKGFICAQVMKYTDFIQLGSELTCKSEGKHRQQGKQYIVEDGDMIFFKFNVSKSKK